MAALLNMSSSQAPRRPRGQPTRVPQPRNTSTTRQLESVSQEREEMEAGGNHAAKISDIWTCSTNGCYNQGKLCYHAGANNPVNHCAIIRPVLVAWSDAIRQGLMNAKEPSHEMLTQMMVAKHNQEHSPSRRTAGVQHTVAQGQPITIYASGSPLATPVVATPLVRSGPYSSPVRMPSGSSADLSTLEKIDAFIEFCKSERCWRGEEEDLLNVRLALKDNGDSVESMANATVEEWRDLEIRNGYRCRLKASARRWIAAGMPSSIQAQGGT
jgi:hypothetical protein